ncbi:PfkB family carbohydrate kinase [Kribbella lupini]|uniref:PfkB family carbohydrate kinase n=1 Tax=Kribbella lupini TaxID=291602 RepID=A0ABN2AAH8_9ACTN
MANRDDPDSSEAVVLTHALRALRMRAGVVLARLEDTKNEDVASLLNLPVVRAHAERQEIGRPDAALQIIAQAVRDTEHATHRIVADAVLGLGVLADVYAQHGLDDKVIQSLRAGAVGRRRATLLANWRRLHEAMDETATEPPSDRTLRGSTEPEVLRQLARRLIQPGPVSPTAGPLSSAHDPAPPPNAPAGRVIVVGGAVMDAIFRTRMIPQHETSVPAHDFTLSPGGKGVTQAIAAARLGLKVSLVAAVADDQFGHEIVQHLRTENVDTSLLKIVRGARTPMTGVFELSLGDSIAAVWRNEKEISLTVRDVDLLGRQIADCDALLLTFEVPRDTVQRTLSLAHSNETTRPIVIVTPGQPHPDGRISRSALGQIDYLVAHTWELERYGPTAQDRFDADRLGEHLLDGGVDTLCLLGTGSGLIYSRTAPTIDRLPTVSRSPFKEVSITRDAFCAALAAKLIDDGPTLTAATARWVTAAMACAAEDFPLSTTMPDRDRINRKLREAQNS